MIAGVGLDLLNASRIAESLKQHGDRLARRVLHADEFAEYLRRGGAGDVRGQRYLAARFAAKEAFSKAWGTGIGAAVSFHAISVLNADNGAPVLQTHGQLQAAMDARGLRAWVTLSDEGDFVVAHVLLEQAGQR